MFWVVVWMQDANENLISEMPGHGLTGIPSAGAVNPDGETTVHYPGVVQFEECQPPDSNNNISCYGNNLGLYKQVFYIAPPLSLGAAPGPTNGTVDIGKLEVSADQVTPRDNVVLSATLSASGAAVSGVNKGKPSQVVRRAHPVRVACNAAQ